MPEITSFLRQQTLAKKAELVRYDGDGTKFGQECKCVAERKGSMVEKIIQKEEERTEGGNVLFKLPKHIKQMGCGGNNPEIYIEDYAEGYLRRLAGSDYTECRVAVLVGEFIKSDGKRYVFIRGAIEAEDVMDDNVPKFTSDAWAGVYEKVKRYFPQYEVVGWFLGGPEFLTEVNETIKQTHVDWFGGRDRVLYKVDPVEKDAKFYLYDKGELTQWPGYCIYYERNEEMQDYLVSGKPVSVDAGYKEPILAEIGRKVGRKTEEETLSSEAHPESPVAELRKQPNKEAKNEKGENRYGVGMVAAAALLVVGAFALREARERGIGVTGEGVTLSPSPTVAGAMASDDIGSFLETGGDAVLTPTELPQVTTAGSVFDGEFTPIDEEPYVPGEGGDISRQAEAGDTENKTTPFLTPTPEPEDNGVMVTDAMELYIVQNGDTLAGICRQFYGDLTRMEEVKGINQIPDEDWIYAGQELYLP